MAKVPGADCLMRDVLPEIERRMLADFPDHWREWLWRKGVAKADRRSWYRELRRNSARAYGSDVINGAASRIVSIGAAGAGSTTMRSL